jgi:hypothetical protein
MATALPAPPERIWPWLVQMGGGRGGWTRLVIRTRSRGRPRLVTRPFGLLVGEPVHFMMQTRQFHNLRTRVGAQV